MSKDIDATRTVYRMNEQKNYIQFGGITMQMNAIMHIGSAAVYQLIGNKSLT